MVLKKLEPCRFLSCHHHSAKLRKSLQNALQSCNNLLHFCLKTYYASAQIYKKFHLHTKKS